ncbi:hypothetical protein ACHAXR_007498, partial [Thalassiosira sp. AJA248-18]
MAPFRLRAGLPVLLFLASFILQLIGLVVAGERGSRQRRRLSPNESIHRYLQEENEAGNMQPKFTLVSAMNVDGEEEDASELNHYDIDVVQATSAVTATTTYSIQGGPHHQVGDLGVKFLVQDRSSMDENDGIAHIGAKPTTFALISVDENTEIVNGIAKKKGEKAMQIQQTNSNSIASPAADFVPPKDFRCQVTREHYHRAERAGRRIVEDEGLLIDEHLNEVDYHHHEPHHNHDHVFSEDDIDHLINGMTLDHHHQPHKNMIPQQSVSRGFPDTPTYQVDLYIEIDAEFILKNGSTNQTRQQNQTDAFKYINTIVTASSSIFETEVNTRLTVAHIEITNHYDNAANSSQAIEWMRNIYSDESEWHYTEGNGVDLHHAILGKKLSGGSGYGISPHTRGNFLTLDFATVWDMSVFSHEIGHNFGAFHTFDKRGFKVRVHIGIFLMIPPIYSVKVSFIRFFQPPVDRCFIRGNSDTSTCPPDARLEGAATLMSYCDNCPRAGVESLAYTFGGDFVGDDPKDINGWRNNPSLAGSFNNEPKRVPKLMYDHVSSKGACVEPNFSCNEDVDCFDSRQCTINTCNQVSGSCEREFKDNCCGNGICEPNEWRCNTDCGPFNLETSPCQKCSVKRGRGNGIMFDIQSLSSELVTIYRIQFRHTETQRSTVTIYTADGSYVDQATTPEEWTVAYHSTEVKIEGKKGGYATAEFPIAILPESIRAFYITSTGKLISGHHEEGVNQLAIDNTLSINSPARIVGSPFGGGIKGS